MDGLTVALIVVPLIIGAMMWFGLRQVERTHSRGVKSRRRDLIDDYALQSGVRDKNAPW